MTVQFSDTVRNAALDAMETAMGASPLLRLYDLSAGAPANCAASITGTLLAEMTLPADFMANASGGAKSLSGTWSDPGANNAGVADFYRIWNAAGTVCHEQGTVSLTGGGGDMTLDNTNITANQVITITSKTWNAGGA